MSQFPSHVTENVKCWSCSGHPTLGSYCTVLNKISIDKCRSCGKERGSADYAKDANGKIIGTFETKYTVMYMDEFDHSMEAIGRSDPTTRLTREADEARRVFEAREAREADEAFQRQGIIESSRAEYERSRARENPHRNAVRVQGEGRSTREARERQQMPPPPRPARHQGSSCSAESSKGGSKRKHSDPSSRHRNR